MIFIIGATRGPPDKRPLKVLIVDDDRDIHDVLEEVITDEDTQCVVTHAYDGRQALEMMRKACPDLLILDVRMPVMDGLALREEMLHDPELINVQIAVITGQVMNTTELQVLLADFYLPKPVSLNTLINVLKTAKENLGGIAQRSQKRAEAAVARLTTVINDLTILRDSLAAKLKK